MDDDTSRTMFDAAATSELDAFAAAVATRWPEVKHSRSARAREGYSSHVLELLFRGEDDVVGIELELKSVDARWWCSATLLVGQRTLLSVETCLWTDDTVKRFVALIAPDAERMLRLSAPQR